MLAVLHKSYLYALDTVMYGGGQTICPRLSDKEGRQLGKDLARYWDVKNKFLTQK